MRGSTKPAAGNCASLIFLSVFCFVIDGAVWGQAQPNQVRSATSSRSATWNSWLAIADFDGDQKPDLATVGLQLLDSDSGRYLIRLRLTSEAGQLIKVTGALGLPRIVARDVNGDNAQDLIISTTGQPQPLAVLLNDGHGYFKLASPTEFSVSLSDSPSNWTPWDREFRDTGGLVASRTSLAGFNVDNALYIPQRAPGSPFFVYQRFLSKPLYSYSLSRATPAFE
jgi:hypothetical protein